MNKDLNYNYKNDSIDIGKLLKLFIRNKKTIYLFGLIFFVFSLIFSFGIRKEWEGEFQIVLDDENNNLNYSTDFANIINSNLMKTNSLKTEVGILKSPSLLSSIFDFVNKEYLKENPKSDGLKYKKWASGLSIDLQKNTSILNISYQDSNKEIILPVLNKLSKKYQDYSGRAKKRNIELAKNYLSEQINIFNKKSSESLRSAQEFGIAQDLIVPDSNKEISNDEKKYTNLNEFNRVTDVEKVRVQAANEIRKIDIQISQIQNLGSNAKQIQYLGITIPALLSEGLPGLLKEMEVKLSKMRTKYSENDRAIKNLIEERDLMIELIKERSIGYLKARKSANQSIMEAAMRPKGVLLKYKELIRKARRNEDTLIVLENKLNSIKLEEAKSEDPWELITEPTLNSSPVSISKKKVVFIGSIIGILLGFIFSLLKEKKSGIILDEDEYEKIFKTTIFQNNFDGNITNLYLIDIIKNIGQKDIHIFSFNIPNNENLETLKKNIVSLNSKVKIYVYDDLSKIKNSEILILFTCIGNLKFNHALELNMIKEKYNLKFTGIIFN